jgi:hypothetical protein
MYWKSLLHAMKKNMILRCVIQAITDILIKSLNVYFSLLCLFCTNRQAYGLWHTMSVLPTFDAINAFSLNVV